MRKDEFPIVDKFVKNKAESNEHSCETCKWGEYYKQGYDITMLDDECGGCCSWNDKWQPMEKLIEPQERGNKK